LNSNKIGGDEMDLEKHFQVPAQIRAEFIDDVISRLPQNQRDFSEPQLKQQVEQLVADYCGVEMDALSILYYAAPTGKFEEYALKLKKQHKEDLSYVPISGGMRGNLAIPAVSRTHAFFMACYKELGVKPQQ
jgi:hypothetical protein